MCARASTGGSARESSLAATSGGRFGLVFVGTYNGDDDLGWVLVPADFSQPAAPVSLGINREKPDLAGDAVGGFTGGWWLPAGTYSDAIGDRFWDPDGPVGPGPAPNPTVPDPTVPPGAKPANTSPPTVRGPVRQGERLTAVGGVWTGASTTTFQWQRCSSAKATSCRDIPGAEGIKYTVRGKDFGKHLRVVETAINSAGSASQASRVVGPVGPPVGAGVVLMAEAKRNGVSVGRSGTAGLPLVCPQAAGARCTAEGVLFIDLPAALARASGADRTVLAASPG